MLLRVKNKCVGYVSDARRSCGENNGSDWCVFFLYTTWNIINPIHFECEDGTGEILF